MTYDYRCKACERAFEIEATFEEKSAGLKPACPSCGSTRTMQVFTPLGVLSGGRPKEFEPCSPTCACAREQTG